MILIRRLFRRLLDRSSGGKRSGLLKLVLGLAILVALPVAAYVRGFGIDPSSVGANSTEMVVENVDVQRGGDRINLVLKEKTGPRRVVVALGIAETASIISDLKLPYQAPEVNAYGLTRQITDGLGGRIQRVVVDNSNDRALFAKVVVATDTREIAVDAAPSDAIALAVRAKVPIYIDSAVLEKVGVVSGR